MTDYSTLHVVSSTTCKLHQQLPDVKMYETYACNDLRVQFFPPAPMVLTYTFQAIRKQPPTFTFERIVKIHTVRDSVVVHTNVDKIRFTYQQLIDYLVSHGITSLDPLPSNEHTIGGITW